jgi:hypothetical protein
MTHAGRCRRVAVALVALSCALSLLAACSPKPPAAALISVHPTLASSTTTIVPKPAYTPTLKPAAQVPRGIKVEWTVKSGTARQDPMGIMSSTPLVRRGSSLHASRTVTFKPAVAGATSTTGKYVYTLVLNRSPADPLAYKGKMRIDWTMTIVHPDSKNEFHSAYDADATARYDTASKLLTGGLAKGTSVTTDTYLSGATKAAPNRRVDPFEWTFSSQ